LLVQVDERRNPRTKATLNQLLDRWLEVAELEPTTRSGYVQKLDKHVRPVLGAIPVGRLDAEKLEAFYAALRRCREHCDGRRHPRHGIAGPHDCDARCTSHECRPLAAATVRQVHAILAAALNRAARWRWITVSPAGRWRSPPRRSPIRATVCRAGCEDRQRGVEGPRLGDARVAGHAVRHAPRQTY
jgi:integrase